MYAIVPRLVRNLTIAARARELNITWMEPEEKNGIIQNYKVVVTGPSGVVYDNEVSNAVTQICA